MTYGGRFTPSGPKPSGERRKELLARMNARRLFTNQDTARKRGPDVGERRAVRRRVVVARNEWTAILSRPWA